jgi:hypothetical protein
MAFRVRALQKNYQMHKEMAEEKINYEVSYRLLSNRDFSKIKEILLNHTPPLRSYLEQVDEDESNPVLASQVNNVLKTPVVNDASAVFRSIVILIWLCAFVLPFVLFLTVDLNWVMSFLMLENI